ncbi:hypothetical protein MVEN_02342200 [Mycena venus]|uniref:Uncharacterized protein n=1 Tax=Mycena venus TaxID=2733690 RepID=A0A8H7CFA8_9AGAR|nr:hypothetical protein MVEN_02342200 [Mycena venus]
MPSLFERARTAFTLSKSKHKPPSESTLPPLLSVSAKPLTPDGGRGRPSGSSATCRWDGRGAVGFLPTTLPVDPAVPCAELQKSQSLSASTSSTSSKDKGGDVSSIFGPAPAPHATACSPLRATPFSASLTAPAWCRPFVPRSSARASPPPLSSPPSRSTSVCPASSTSSTLFWRRVGTLLPPDMGRRPMAAGRRGCERLPPNRIPHPPRLPLAQVPPILSPFFALCNKLVAHSDSSGETPLSLAGVRALFYGLTSDLPRRQETLRL